MRWSNMLVRCIFCIGSLTLCSNASAKFSDVTEFGTPASICLGGVETQAEFQSWTASNQPKVRSILTSAEWPGDPEVLFEAIRLGKFSEKQYHPGTSFKWTGVMRKGKPVALPEKIWAGKAAFTGYEVIIKSGNAESTFIIPKVCCNFSLLWEGVPIDTPVTVPVPVKVTGVPLAIPSLKKITPKAAPAKRTRLFAKVFVGSEKFKFKSNVGGTDNACEKCEPCKFCEDNPVEVGGETIQDTANASLKRDNANLIGASLGVEVPISDGLKFYPSIGLINRSGESSRNTISDMAVNIDLELRQSIFENWFIGGGLGSWNINDSDFNASSVFVSAGRNLNDKLDFFVEQRRFEGTSSGENNAFVAGLSLTFDDQGFDKLRW